MILEDVARPTHCPAHAQMLTPVKASFQLSPTHAGKMNEGRERSCLNVMCSSDSSSRLMQPVRHVCGLRLTQHMGLSTVLW